jgi:hypothetical protein
MFARPKFTTAIPAIEQQNTRIIQSPKLMTTAMKRNTSRLRTRWKTALSVEPAPAPNYYPLRYRSARQRRKVHAMRKERGGGAYTRTHALSKGWKVDLQADENGGNVTVTNRAPEAAFVIGEFRQPMFDARVGGIPWLDPNEVNRKFAIETQVVIAETWKTIADPRAGVPR